jgi:polyferredoxin
MQKGMSSAEIRRRALRPRVLIYLAVLLAIVTAFGVSLAMRTPLKMDVLRDRGAMGRELDGGVIENVYRLQIMNTSETPHRYRILVDGIPTARLAGTDEVTLQGTETRSVPVRVQVDGGQGAKGSNRIHIALEADDGSDLKVREEAVFFVPR